MIGKKLSEPYFPERGRKIFSLTCGEIAQITGGKIIKGDPFRRVRGVSTDSRQIKEDNLFVPLKGAHFDGHNFIGAALAKGAAGSLMGEEWTGNWTEENCPGKFLIVVPSVLKALGDLARFWRQQFPLPVIAITGSNGKTTTKEMTAKILASKFSVLKTEGNLNNLIGLPLMLFHLCAQHEIAVLEMGMNNFGEIRRLREISSPQISAILNIGQAHLEFLGGIEGVARAKGELWEEVKKDDWIAINRDDPRVVALAAQVNCRKKTYGIKEKADLQAEDIRYDREKGVRFVLRMAGQKEFISMGLHGQHNIYNALAAAALSSIVGISLQEIGHSLKDFSAYPGRGQILSLKENIKIWDDSYNANPDSLRASLLAFKQVKGGRRGLLVLGDMLELGAEGPTLHEEMGRLIGRQGLAYLFLLGEQAPYLAKGAQEAGMKKEFIFIGQSHEQVAQALKEVCQAGDWILIKGSRKTAMEKIISALEEREKENG